LECRTFFAFLLIWKEQSLFCRSFEKIDCVDIRTITLLKRATQRAMALLLFCKEKKKSDHILTLLKERLSEQSHNRSFEKSDEKSNRSLALFKRANEKVIAQSLFSKEQK